MSASGSTSIRTKLAITFGTALALIVAVGLVGLMELQAVNNVTKEFKEVLLPRIELLGEIKRLTVEHRLLATRRTQTTNFRYLATISQGMEQAIKGLHAAEQAYVSSKISEEERQLFSEFLALWKDYEDTLRLVYQRIEGGEISLAFQEFNTVSLASFDRAASKLNELIGLSKVRSAVAAVRAQEVYDLAILLTIAVILAAALFAGGAIFWTSRRVSAPLLDVSAAMQRLALGDYSVEVKDDHKRKDEIGVLISAVAGYRNSLIRSRALADQAELERERLDAAVSNMPIGLCMFDSNRQLIISNRRYADIYGLPAELTTPGTGLREILEDRVRAGIFTIADPDRIMETLLKQVTGEKPSLNLVELKDGRTLSIVHQPMAGGGWVATHEDVTDRRQAEARIRHMARHDALTDLPNRILFKERLEEALKRMPRGDSVAVLCLDLDHFKSVNDTLGHPIGDALLESVAERLRASVRENDTVARLGGDEFALAQVGAEQPGGATVLAHRVIEALSTPYDIEGHQVVIGASVGIAVAPSDGSDADTLQKNGDMALYRAKSEGRGTYRFFEMEMDARMQARRALELDLRKAVMQNEFDVHYQPLVDLHTNEISTLEGLLRWHHPTRGLVPPMEFIPLAEEIGLIVPIGEWVLRRACLDAMTWPGDVRVAVNISPIQFKSKRLLESVVSALALSKLPATRLELEITEGVLLMEHASTLATLHQLRALGVRIAMDDFGTGYSSLSYLRSFPFDKIKIDRSFINNITTEQNSVAIVRAVIGLSASLGMATTAEGVETREQLDRVRAEGCTEVQGFLLSAAKPADQILAILEASAKRIEVAA
jgi:diguanylate cyclase (GGDEF)-like protein